MKYLRAIPIAVGLFLLGISIIIFFAATGIGWFGEQIMKIGFSDGHERRV